MVLRRHFPALTPSRRSFDGELAVNHAEGAPQFREVIPRTLAQNCGANVIRVLTDLRTRHSEGQCTWGVNGTTGEPVDMTELGIWEPYCVKAQTLKTAIESSNLILRIDDVVSGTRRKQG